MSKATASQARKSFRTNTKKQNPQRHRKPFPIVGIGASAGGLEAFSKFLQHLPSNLGMAYVYVQHLSPDYQSMLPEILEKRTEMPVIRVTSNLELKKNTVYVVPENHSIRITDGIFKLTERVKDIKFFYPIDHFLNSLADVYQANAIGIILSGTGTDGTIGLRSIREEGGMTFAQDDSAKYIGMPQNATEAGAADFVMPPEKIAGELSMMVNNPKTGVISQNEIFEENKNNIGKILFILHNRMDVDFSHYKQTTIHRRIIRRMMLNRLNSLTEYIKLLRENEKELKSLYNDLLINVTGFFRDPNIYEALSKKVLPALLKNRELNTVVRVWIPGCATGEEAVSFAIVMLEYLSVNDIGFPIQIFSTDLNEKAIERARAGIYNPSAVQNISSERLKRFFVSVDGGYQVTKIIRDICIFASHNLLKDPPFSKMDIISCQNLLIYLESAPQKKILRSFHYALKSDGFLLLGKSETIGNAIELFDQPYKEFKLYTKKNISSLPDFELSRNLLNVYNDQNPTAVKKIKPGEQPELDIEKTVDKILLNKYVPATVIINKDYEILRFRGATSKFLEPASGKASLYLMKMVREDLLFELRNLLNEAKQKSITVKKSGIQIRSNNQLTEVSIEIVPLLQIAKQPYYIIIFRETALIPTVQKKSGKESGLTTEYIKKNKSLTDQLEATYGHIQAMTEEFEATREELQSANEEVLSSNEELQSINEELETSKEELQSTNEELITINDELHNRNQELRDSRDFVETIFQSMHESIIVLDNSLQIITANKTFFDTFHLKREEVIGNYIYNFDNGQWNLPELRKILKQEQLKEVDYKDIEIETNFKNVGPKTLLLSLSRMPDGESNKEGEYLVTIQDISRRKQMEIMLKENEERLRLLIQNSSDILQVISAEGNIIYESDSIKQVLGYTSEQRLGKNIFEDPIVHPEDLNAKQSLIAQLVKDPQQRITGEFRLQHANGTYRIIEAVGVNRLSDHRIRGIVLSYRDITERKLLQQQKDQFIGIASHELKTPVTTIKAIAQHLESELQIEGNHEAVELTRKMNFQIDKVVHLINDFLDITKIEYGRLQFRLEKFRINNLISEVVEEFESTTKRKFKIKLGKNKLLTSDKERINQVIENLITNACKYSFPKSVIEVGCSTDDNVAKIWVRNRGPVIPPDKQEKIFERFFRLDHASNQNMGIGLGLYISSEIIKKAGGKIWLKSLPAHTTFYFTLPIKIKNNLQ